MVAALEIHLQDWLERLRAWSADGSLASAARHALELGADDPPLLSELTSQWTEGDFSALPPIVLLPASSMPGAAGAYAISTGTIYLNEDWVETAGDERVIAVLTEELGHHLDGLLDPSDTPGDEGELISRLLLTADQSADPHQAISLEHDQIQILVDGEWIDAEASEPLSVSTLAANNTIVNWFQKKYGNNETLDRFAVTGPLQLGDAERRDGLVLIRIGTKFGSGAYLGNGYILTNAHVVAAATTQSTNLASFGVTTRSNPAGGTQLDAVLTAEILETYIYPQYDGGFDVLDDVAIVRVRNNLPTQLSTWNVTDVTLPSDDFKDHPIVDGQRYDPIQAGLKYLAWGYPGTTDLTDNNNPIVPDRNGRAWPVVPGFFANSLFVQGSSRPQNAQSLFGLNLIGTNSADDIFPVNNAGLIKSSFSSQTSASSSQNGTNATDSASIHHLLYPLYDPRYDRLNLQLDTEYEPKLLGIGAIVGGAVGFLVGGPAGAAAGATLGQMYDTHKSTIANTRRGDEIIYLEPIKEGDTYKFLFLNTEVAAGNSGGPVQIAGRPGTIAGLVTFGEAPLPTAGGINILGKNEINWINQVLNGTITPTQTGLSLTGTASTDFSGLAEIGFASVRDPGVLSKVYTPFPVVELNRTINSKALVPDVSNQNYNLVNVEIPVINASNISLRGDIQIAIEATNLSTKNTRTIHQYSFTDLDPILGAGKLTTSSFRLSSSSLPDFGNGTRYDLHAVIDPQKTLQQTSELSDRIFLGTYLIEAPKGPQDGLLTIKSSDQQQVIASTSDAASSPFVYSEQLASDLQFLYSVDAGDFDLSKVSVQASLPNSFVNAGIGGNHDLPKRSGLNIDVSPKGLYEQQTDFYQDEYYANRYEAAHTIEFSLQASDVKGLLNAPIDVSMPLSHRASRLEIKVPSIQLPNSNSRLFIKFKDVDADPYYDLAIYKLDDSLYKEIFSMGSGTTIWNANLPSPIYEKTLVGDPENPFRSLRYEVNDLPLAEGENNLLVSITDPLGNRRRYLVPEAITVGDLTSFQHSPVTQISRQFLDSAPLMSIFEPRAVDGLTAFISSNEGSHIPVLKLADGTEILLRGVTESDRGDASFSQEISLTSTYATWAEGFGEDKELYLFHIPTRGTYRVSRILNNASDVERIKEADAPVITAHGLYWMQSNNLYGLSLADFERGITGNLSPAESVIELIDTEVDVLAVGDSTSLIYQKERFEQDRTGRVFVHETLSGSTLVIPGNPVNVGSGGGRIAWFDKSDQSLHISNSDLTQSRQIKLEKSQMPISFSGGYLVPQTAVSDNFIAWLAPDDGILVFDGTEIFSVNTDGGFAYAIALDGNRLVWNSDGSAIKSVLLFNQQQMAVSDLPLVSVSSLTDSVSESLGYLQSNINPSFEVTRSGNLEQSLTVLTDFYGTAEYGIDYTSDLKGAIYFEPGQSSKLVHITTVANGWDEGNRTIALDILPGPGYTFAPDPDASCSAELILLDNPQSHGPFINVRKADGALVRPHSPFSSSVHPVIFDELSLNGSVATEWFEITNDSPYALLISQSLDSSSPYAHLFALTNNYALNPEQFSLEPYETARLAAVFKPETSDEQRFAGEAAVTVDLLVSTLEPSVHESFSYQFDVVATSTGSALDPSSGVLAPQLLLNDRVYLDGQTQWSLTSQDKPVFHGRFKGEPSTSYQLQLIDADSGAVLASDVLEASDTDVYWTLAPELPLLDGVHNLRTRLIHSQTQAVLDDSSVTTFLVDARLPATPTNLSWIYDDYDPSSPVLVGEGLAESSVRLHFEGNLLASADVNKNGTWRLDLSPISELLFTGSVVSGLTLDSLNPGNGALSESVHLPLQRHVVDPLFGEVFLPSVSKIDNGWKISETPAVFDDDLQIRSFSSSAETLYHWFAGDVELSQDGRDIIIPSSDVTDFSSLSVIQSFVDGGQFKRTVATSPLSIVDSQGNTHLVKYVTGEYQVLGSASGSVATPIVRDDVVLNINRLPDSLDIVAAEVALIGGTSVNKALVYNGTKEPPEIWTFDSDWSYQSTDEAVAVGSSLAAYYEGLFRLDVDGNNSLAPQGIKLKSLRANPNPEFPLAIAQLAAIDFDQDDVHSFEVLQGVADADSFVLEGDLLLAKNQSIFDSARSLTVGLRVTDRAGLFHDGQYLLDDIDETPPNNAPTDLSITASAFDENITAGTAVGTLSTTDPDIGDTFTYALVNGIGSADNDSFSIIGDQLKINTSPDYEDKLSYNIRVRTTDQGGLSFEKNLTLNVEDVTEEGFSLNPATMIVLYVAYYGRPADVGGLQFWQSKVAESGFTYAPRLGDGLTETERPLYDRIVVDFGDSIESQQLYAGKTKQESADTVYQYCFGRDAEIDPLTGENYWVGKLERNEITLSQLAAEVALGAQGPDLTFMNNRIEAANLFFNAMDTPAEQLGYSGPNDDALARNWLLQFGFTRATSAMADDIMETIVATI